MLHMAEDILRFTLIFLYRSKFFKGAIVLLFVHRKSNVIFLKK